MDLLDKIINLIPKDIENNYKRKDNNNINKYNKYELDKESEIISFDRKKFFNNKEQMIRKYTDTLSPSKINNLLDEMTYLKVECDDIDFTYGSTTSSEFFNMINSNEYSNKNLFKFWYKYDRALNTSILKEYEKQSVKKRRGNNSFILIPLMQSTAILDYHSICFTSHVTNNEINIHDHILGSQLKFYKKSIEFKYIPYTHYIKPKVIMIISDKEESLDYNGGHTQLTITPKGFYRFSDSFKNNPTNISSIYYVCGEIYHTRKDFIIYEINDEIVSNDVNDKRKDNFLLTSDVDTIIEASPILNRKSKKKNKKEKKQKRLENNLILLNNKELNDLIRAVVESEPVYESDDDSLETQFSQEEDEEEEEEEESEEEEVIIQPKKEIIKKEIKKEPEIKLHFLPNVEGKKFISKAIHNAIEKKSKFYELVKDTKTIYIVNGLHNSFHKTERYDHFNIKLTKEHITYHVYTDDERIMYFTELVYNYD